MSPAVRARLYRDAMKIQIDNVELQVVIDNEMSGSFKSQNVDESYERPGYLCNAKNTTVTASLS